MVYDDLFKIQIFNSCLLIILTHDKMLTIVLTPFALFYLITKYHGLTRNPQTNAYIFVSTIFTFN